MATPAVIGFHNATGIEERNKVLLRIQQGTKASSPQIRSYRRQHLDIYQPHATLPDNSTGSKNRPFYASKGEPSFSSEDMKMRGGVLSTKEGQKYGKFLLNRRANDIRAKDLVAQGIEPSSVLPSGELVLTPEDSKALELNTLLQSISDAVDARDFGGLTITDLKNIPRLMITTLPKMTQRNFGELVEFIGELTEELEAIVEPKEDVDEDRKELQLESKTQNQADRIKNYLLNILALLRDFAKVMGSDEGTKIATLRALVGDFLGLSKYKPTSVIPQSGQASVLKRRLGQVVRDAGQPIASGEQRNLPQDVNARIAVSTAPKPRRAPRPLPARGVRRPRPASPALPASLPPPDDEKEPEDEEEDEDEAPPPLPKKILIRKKQSVVVAPPRLTEAEKRVENGLNEAFRLTNSSMASRIMEGMKRLRAFLDEVGVQWEEKDSRTKLKNFIEKNSKYFIY
nr:MAG: hypothetical protein [Lake Baikal virophage 12]